MSVSFLYDYFQAGRGPYEISKRTPRPGFKRRSTHVPNKLGKFDFRATLERQLVQTAYFRRTLFRRPVVTIRNNFRRENMRSDFKNSVQIEKL